MTLAASQNAGSAQPGPNYGCLGTQPNPAWFFLQISQSGSLTIAMSAAQDIDFICWGPFSALNSAVCNSLTSGNTVGCSYSPSNTETCTILNAQAGSFYILLVTNFANVQQNITMVQNNLNQTGAAATNCGFVCTLTATNSGVICAGQSNTISVTTSSAINSFTWHGPGNFTSNTSSNTLNNVGATTSYTVVASASTNINGSVYTGSCQSVTTLTVIPFPLFSVTPGNTTVCQGGSVTPVITFSPGYFPSQHTYTWFPSAGSTIWNPWAPATLIQPPQLPSTTSLATIVYSVAVSRSASISCPVTQTFAVTINNPLTPTLTMPPPQCDTYAPVSLSATPGGGTWSANSAVSPGGFLNPALAALGTNSVQYSYMVGNCIVNNYDSFSVSKFISPALTSSLSMVCEQDGGYNLMSIVQNTTGSWQGVNTAGNIFVPTGLATGVYNFTYNTTSTPIASVCPASTVLAVSVFKPPVPVISHINATCNNGPTVALTANPSGGSWTLNPGVSLSGIQTPSLNSIGTNTVTYIAGQGTCVASSSATFHVSQFNTAALTGTVPNLCVTASPVNLMAIVQSTLNGSWNGPGLITTGGYSFSPAFLPTAVYTLTYNTTSSPQAGLCDHSSTIKVSVFNPPVPNITQVGPYCSTDAPLQLTVSPATGTWTALSYINKSGLFTPSLAAIGNNLVQYIIGTPTCNTQQTKFISVEGFVSAHISSRLPELCNTSSAVNLIPLTVNGSGVWSGTGVQGTYFNPSASGAGNFTLSYQTASSPSGLCPDKDTLSVRVYSLAAPLVTSQAPLCDKSEPVQLQVSPLGGIFGGANTSAISSSGMFNPAFGIIGDNIVSYSIASGPCLAYAQTTISVAKFVSADFGKYPEAFCQNSQPMNLNSLVLNPGGQWSGKGITGSMFNPLKAEIGLNTVEYRTYSDPYPLLCPDSKTISIRVDKMPVISVAGTTMGCAPLQAVFTMPQTNLGQGEWNTGDSDVLYPGTDLVHIYTTPGSYSVTFNYTLGACQTRTTLANPVVVYPSPVTDFSFSKPELTIAEPEVTLNNLTPALGDYKYQWDIQGQETRYEVNPTVSFPEAGTWHVTLKATSLNNCIAEITKTILVKNEIGVYVPNVFTPNADGLNDVFLPVFTPYGLDETSFRMQIFDRWGHLVYSTSDLTKGWDGSYQNKGELAMKQEVYIYTLRYKDLDGQLHEQTGYVSLMPK